MAKKNGNGSDVGEAGEERVNGGSAPVKSAMPAGFSKPASSVEQFWREEDGPITGFLRGGKSYVNKASRRVNTIYIFELHDPCSVETSKGELIQNKAQKGELVGVWGSPGMRDLMGLQGCLVWMARNGVKDVGQPSPMKVYEIGYRGQGQALVITSAGDSQNQSQRATDVASQGTDNIPF